MAHIDLSNVTKPNGAAKFDSIVYQNWFIKTPLNRVFTIMERQKDGAAVVGVKPFRLLGKASQGCDPEYGDSGLNSEEKKWDIKEWDIAEKFCYKDIDDTILEEVMNVGINAANIIDTRYYHELLEPAIIDGIDDMLFRFAFFGNKNITGAELQNAGDVEHFNLIDGIWKQIFDAVAAKTITRYEIAANKQTTSAAQMSAFEPGSGEAVKLIRNIQTSAPIELRQARDKVMYISQSLYDAYVADKQEKYIGSEGQWESLENGDLVGKINGIETIVLAEWDRIIQNFLKNTENANAFDHPHRAIFTVKGNLLLGTESNGDFKTLIGGFNDEKQYNWVLGKNTIGAMPRFDNLTHVAF